jgi:methylenetetrahydrofolate reductase (NADPH)
LILEGLEFVPKQETVKRLPWTKSLAVNRTNESVRPIFWKNRPKSYISRTASWDDFPNGRWGDSRSPAFGDLDGYGVKLKYPMDHCLKLWGQPVTLTDVADLFVDYIHGKLNSLPWCDSPLQQESGVIKDRLLALNKHGVLTINSQPAVDGALSSDKVFGWGPKNGFVYQKAYLEFFVSPETLDLLLKKVNNYAFFSYYAIKKDVKFN